jgi:hypothetical protein
MRAPIQIQRSNQHTFSSKRSVNFKEIHRTLPYMITNQTEQNPVQSKTIT